MRTRLGDGERLNLIAEVTGQKRLEKAAKLDAARTYWLPASRAFARSTPI